MIYADAPELVAALILNEHKHRCGPDCLCWYLRAVPAIAEAIAALQAEKLQRQAEIGTPWVT